MEFKKPEMEVVRFGNEDIIVTSGECHGYCETVCPNDCISVCKEKCYKVTASPNGD